MPMLEMKDKLRNTFKLMLTEGVDSGEERMMHDCQKDMGPPGGKYFVDAIHHDLQQKVHIRAMMFSLRSIFGLLAHWALLLSTDKLEKMHRDVMPQFSMDLMRDMIRHHVRAILSYVRKNPELSD